MDSGMNIGTMVRSGASEPMKILGFHGEVAECVQVDGNGFIRRRYHPIRQLTPMVNSLQPRSLWPEITRLDQVANDREERRALAQKEAARKAKKKAKRSNKIRRRGSEAA
jgi:hypothetical protein